ncbi:MYCBP-associated protein-like isoform X3 [Babylonia areolata]|uniref:MYCBP-associated protein-like isoform X3 n=1 Tax=Babylonia areolata TaxID=304850 RepID=UPI003FCFA844
MSSAVTSRNTSKVQMAKSKIDSMNRLKGKRRDGTPDKSTTPSQEAQDENRPPSRHIIWDEEIEGLQIKAEDLEKIHVPEPPSEERPPAMSTVTVRKMKPASELNKPKLKSVLVAKPASPDAELKPVDNSGYAGPRYDAAGRVIHYSILGSFEDYRREAISRGDLLDIPTPRIDSSYSGDSLTVKYEKKRKRSTEEGEKKSDESNALRNWQQKMIERKRQQGYISKLLQKAPEDLAMNQADGYRKTQEDRYLIDRTIPFVDYGKGYRVGSEFWKQQEQFGDELTGIHMTLSQTECGYPPPVEHVGIPERVRDEKGIQWEPDYRTPSHHPWHRTSYLYQRRKQLQPIIDELSPHKPDFAGLQIIGTNDPHRSQVAEDMESEDGLTIDGQESFEQAEERKAEAEEDPFHNYPDVHAPPVFGPSLQFAGHTARWTGSSCSHTGQMGAEARVTFETFAETRVTSYLEIVNDGTTSIFFDWKKLPKENPFDLVQPPMQRFYFNNSSGVILPGETLHFPFVFKSGCAGVFTEQWMLETRPVLCGGAALVLTLRGVALEEDKFQQQRVELERDLENKQSQQVVVQLLEELVAGVRTPLRCPSPVDAYITEEEMFRRFNPGLSYQHQAVSEMKEIHLQLFSEEEKESAVWDLCVLDLKDMIMELDEDDERKESLLAQLNSVASTLTFDPPQPVGNMLHNLCHKLLAEAVDTMVTQSSLIRQTMGMAAREMGDIMEETEEVPVDVGASLNKGMEKRKSGAGDSRKGGRPADKGKAEASKDKKPAAAAAKDAKAGKPGKEPAKPDPKAKASTPSVAKKAAPSRPPGGGGGPEPRTSTPTSPPQTPDQSKEQGEALERKYREKLYTQTFVILGDTMDRMDSIFKDALKTS